MIIYKATNNINGKVYIGQTINLQRRIWEHLACAKNDSKNYFHSALRKYGKDNFYWIVLSECDNINLLNQLEKYYISCYKSMDRENGYNLTSGGENYIVSEETKQRMRKAQSGKNNPMYGKRGKNSPSYGKKHSEETKQKIRDNVPDRRGEKGPNYGKKHTEETRQKMRDNSKHLRGKDHPMFGKKGKDNPNYGRKHTEEQRKKMSEATKGEKNHNYGKPHAIETIEKMRLARIKYLINNPGSMKGENHPQFGKHRSEETKEKIRLGHIKYWENRKNKTKENNKGV